MKPRPPEKARAWLRMLAPAAAYLPALYFLRALLLRAAAALLPGSEHVPAAASAGATVLLAPLALAAYLRENGRPKGPFPRAVALESAACGLLLGLAAALAARALPGLAEEAGLSGPAWMSALRLAALCAAGPVCEEAVYRGLVLPRAEALLGTAGAALISAALFAVAHTHPLRMAAAFVAGLLFAALTLRARRSIGRSRALIAPLLCHAAANLALAAVQGI